MGTSASLYELSLEQVAACGADPAAAERVVMESGGARLRCDLDKAWGGLRFLFVTADHDIEAALLDFEEGARSYSDRSYIIVAPRDVLALADSFEWPDRALVLAKYYDPTAMRSIYPGICQRDGSQTRDYLLSFIPSLRDFFCGVADRDGGSSGVLPVLE